jgi:hypothetical protein
MYLGPIVVYLHLSPIIVSLLRIFDDDGQSRKYWSQFVIKRALIIIDIRISPLLECPICFLFGDSSVQSVEWVAEAQVSFDDFELVITSQPIDLTEGRFGTVDHSGSSWIESFRTPWMAMRRVSKHRTTVPGCFPCPAVV